MLINAPNSIRPHTVALSPAVVMFHEPAKTNNVNSFYSKQSLTLRTKSNFIGGTVVRVL